MTLGFGLLFSGVLLSTLFQVFRWRRQGVRFPRWVHVLAASGFAVGAFLGLIDRGVDAFGLWESLAMPVVFPVVVYGIFIGEGYDVMEDQVPGGEDAQED